MYCRNCGNKVGDDSVFCAKCGTRIIRTGAEENKDNSPRAEENKDHSLRENQAVTEEKLPRKKPVVIIGAAVILVACIAVIVCLFARK